MSTHRPPLARLVDLAEDQWGLVTTRQAAQVNVPWPSLARMVADRRLEHIANGVYHVRGGAPPDHLELRAAWLQLDPARPGWQRIGDPNAAVVSHTSAAALYSVGDLPTDVYEFTVPVRRQTRRTDVRLHRGTVPEHDRLVVHGLPVTCPGRMIRDLLAAHVEPAAVAQITREVLYRAYDYPNAVAQHIAPYAVRYGLPPHDGTALLDYLLRLTGVSKTAQWLSLVRFNAGVS